MKLQEHVLLPDTKLEFDEFAGLFGAWADKFRPFIEGKEMFEIYEKLKKDGQKEIICPKHEDVFRAFSTSFPEDIKSVWYMMDPYPKRYKNKALQADGIAMSCSNSPDGKLQPSLEKFYEGMEKDLGYTVEHAKDLAYLCEQGVLMLNTDLTCKLNKTGSHKQLWSEFQKYFLGEVMRSTTGIVYVLCGKESVRMERYINPLGNYIVTLDHPVSASYTDTLWDCKNIFTKINKIIKSNNGSEIYWDKRKWDKENIPPF